MQRAVAVPAFDKTHQLHDGVRHGTKIDSLISDIEVFLESALTDAPCL